MQTSIMNEVCVTLFTSEPLLGGSKERKIRRRVMPDCSHGIPSIGANCINLRVFYITR